MLLTIFTINVLFHLVNLVRCVGIFDTALDSIKEFHVRFMLTTIIVLNIGQIQLNVCLLVVGPE